jgi:hypothetical protein
LEELALVVGWRRWSRWLVGGDTYSSGRRLEEKVLLVSWKYIVLVVSWMKWFWLLVEGDGSGCWLKEMVLVVG